MLAYIVKIFEVFVFFQMGNFYLCKMPPKKRSKRRGSHEAERMSTRARSPEVNELSCVPETQQSQQAAGMEELVVGVEDPLEMSDTEQVDIGLETQQDSDSSNEDRQDTEAAGSTQGQADKKSKKPTVLFSTEEEQKF